MGAEDTSGLLDAIDPMAPEVLAEPFAFFASLRQHAPVWRDPHNGFIHVSTHALTLEVNK